MTSTTHSCRVRPGWAAVAVLALTISACTGGSGDSSKSAAVGSASGAQTSAPAAANASTPSASTAAAPATAATAAPTAPPGTTSGGSTATTAPGPAGSQPGLFDFNQDGQKEPTCGTADFKAGLLVRTYCADLSGYTHEPESGATLVPGALFSLPAPPDDPRDPPITSGASVSGQHFQGADGREVVVYTLSSDTVFATGSADLLEPAMASLTAIANGLRATYPGASFQVRGHTDSTGDAAANQSLSEQRGAAVAAFFVSVGLDAAKITSVGLGETVPNYQENTQTGQDQNRRVEIVVRL